MVPCRESQFPAATFTLELMFGFLLGCCSPAVRALHRAKLSHNINLSGFLTSFLGHRLEFVPNRGSVAVTC
jgi:hypothetical protein